MVNATLLGEFGEFDQKLPVNTGAAVSVLSLKSISMERKLPATGTLLLEGYNVRSSIVTFTKPIECAIGGSKIRNTFGLQDLDDEGILGIDAIKKLGAIIVLPNRV